jgi:hypothetical protein
MTTATCTTDTLPATASTEPTGVSAEAEVEEAEGWQALAHALLGRPLTRAELAAVETLAPAHALDLLFPDLLDAARQEALWALG